MADRKVVDDLKRLIKDEVRDQVLGEVREALTQAAKVYEGRREQVSAQVVRDVRNAILATLTPSEDTTEPKKWPENPNDLLGKLQASFERPSEGSGAPLPECTCGHAKADHEHDETGWCCAVVGRAGRHPIHCQCEVYTKPQPLPEGEKCSETKIRELAEEELGRVEGVAWEDATDLQKWVWTDRVRARQEPARAAPEAEFRLENERLRGRLKQIGIYLGWKRSDRWKVETAQAIVDGALAEQPCCEVDHDWGDGFQSLSCGPTCYRYTPPDGGAPEESHGTIDGRGCQGPCGTGKKPLPGSASWLLGQIDGRLKVLAEERDKADLGSQLRRFIEDEIRFLGANLTAVEQGKPAPESVDEKGCEHHGTKDCEECYLAALAPEVESVDGEER